MATELLYLRDAYLREFTATVTEVGAGEVALDRTGFYPAGGRQPHDTGTLGAARVVSVTKRGDDVWHTLGGPLVSFLPRAEALVDDDLIRTKVNLIPESVAEIRVVDIVGLDKQADGGTHVRSTREVGRIKVLKTESKGKGNKRIRLEVVDG